MGNAQRACGLSEPASAFVCSLAEGHGGNVHVAQLGSGEVVCVWEVPTPTVKVLFSAIAKVGDKDPYQRS